MPVSPNTKPLVSNPLISWRAIRKHLMLGGVVAVSVVLASIFYTIGQKRIFEANATIIIDPAPPRPLGKDVQAVVDIGNGSYWDNKEYFATQTKILAGLSIARETVRSLTLQNDTAFIANVPGGQKPRIERRDLSIEDAAEILRARLKVEPIRDSRMVNVSIVDADAERARRILSVVLEIFLARNIDHAVESNVVASEWLDNQTAKLKDELEQSELALHEYKKEKQILSVSLDDQSNMLRGEMQQLNQALTTVSARREELKAQAEELDKVDPEQPTNLPATALLSSALLSTLRQNYVEAKNELSSLLGLGKGPQHPEAAAAAARVENTRLALVAEIKNVQGAIHSDLLAATREQSGVSTLLASTQKRALDLGMLEIEFRRLERTKTNTEKLYGMVLERSKESGLTGMMRFNNIRVAEAPTVGRLPVQPRVPINIALGLVLGVLLGVGTAFARGLVDRTVRTPEDLERELGAPVLGVVPSLNDRNKTRGYYSRRHRGNQDTKSSSKLPDDMNVELFAHALPSSQAAECIRVIRTSLTFSAPDKPYRRILVTSGSPTEGKTTVAASLATVFAQASDRVLIVDADLRRPRMHRVFGCTNAEGVTTALHDRSALERALVQTQVPNLTLLPGGPHVPNPAEVIQSASFARLLEELQERFDRIIIDSPPILAVADATILASLSDVSVLVARAGKTRIDQTRLAMQKLQELSTPIAGVVLNALASPRWGYHQYYYYGYGKSQDGSYGYGNSREA